jgi:hypothetical protein
MGRFWRATFEIDAIAPPPVFTAEKKFFRKSGCTSLRPWPKTCSGNGSIERHGVEDDHLYVPVLMAIEALLDAQSLIYGQMILKC